MALNTIKQTNESKRQLTLHARCYHSGFKINYLFQCTVKMDGDKMLETQREGDNEVLITRVATAAELVSVSYRSLVVLFQVQSPEILYFKNLF